MQPVWLTADSSTYDECRQRMISCPGLIAWQAGQLELLWMTSAGNGSPQTSEHRRETVSALGCATSGRHTGAA